MSKNRLLAAAFLFIAATCIKFTLPSVSAMLHDKLETAMEQETDLRAAAVSLGEKLAPGDELIAVLGLKKAEEAAPAPSPTPAPSPSPDAAPTGEVRLPETLMAIRAENAALFGRAPSAEAVENLAAPAPEPEADAISAPAPEAPANPVVETFLETQSAYGTYALPTNVSYEMPTLGIFFVSPLYGTSSSGFGYRVHPISGEVKFHYGTDFAAWTGTEICCFADGAVSLTGEESGYGRYVVVEHDGGCRSLYAHCSEILVSCGDAVSAGQVIARVGATGQVTGPHLHFELQKDGMYLNPEYYVNYSV